jgi:glycosyltransferase involved in cell wall biosynthesis
MLAYYKRPKIVLNALESIIKLDYPRSKFDFIFIDDSGDSDFQDTLDKYMEQDPNISYGYWPINQDDDLKQKQGGSTHGYMMNHAISLFGEDDIAIVLCDDDALFPDYLTNLSKFYTDNPEVMYAYSYVKYFDPSTQHYSEASEHPKYFHHGSTYTLNQPNVPIDPLCKVDASQVTWRTKCFTKDGVLFPYPQTRGLDAALFRQLTAKYGPCYPTFFFGQYKGAFPDQMGNRGNDYQIHNK